MQAIISDRLTNMDCLNSIIRLEGFVGVFHAKNATEQRTQRKIRCERRSAVHVAWNSFWKIEKTTYWSSLLNTIIHIKYRVYPDISILWVYFNFSQAEMYNGLKSVETICYRADGSRSYVFRHRILNKILFKGIPVTVQLHFTFQSHRPGCIFLRGISIPCEELKCAPFDL